MSEAEIQERDAGALVEELNSLVEELEQYPDTELREKSIDLVQTTLELYGEALRRMLAALDSLPQKAEVMSRLYADEVVRAVLLIHGLMPVELYDRVASAIEHLRPYLISQGCDVELTSVEQGRARVRLIRHGQGAPPVAVLKQELEKSLTEAAPDLEGLDVEGMAEQIEATAKAAALLGRLAAPARSEEQPAQLVQLKRQTPSAVGVTWIPVVRALGFDEGKFKVVRQGDINLLVCKVGGEFYAYRNACPAEGGLSLDDALFESPMLTCSCHGLRYDLRRGNCVERAGLRLESLPAKVEDDKVKVAV